MSSSRACSPPATAQGYARREPEKTALYQVVSRHFPAFKERMAEAGGLPRFVLAEFDEYLRCGLLEHGCLRLACRRCGHEKLVAFSCKRRALCPSCVGRHMADTAVHLEHSVFPEVAIRHWICSLPWGLRALLGYDRELCADVTTAFVSEVRRSLSRRAKLRFGLASVRLPPRSRQASRGASHGVRGRMKLHPGSSARRESPSRLAA